MRLRDSIGLNFSPFILRVVLGLTFLWAGAAKIFSEADYTPEQALTLSQMGVAVPTQGAADAEGAIEASFAQPAEDDLDDVIDDLFDDEPLITDEATEPAIADLAQFGDGVRMRSVYMLALGLHSGANPGFDADGNEQMRIWPEHLGQKKWPVWAAWAAAATELVAGVLMFFGLFTRIGALSLTVIMGVAMWLTQFGPAIQAGDAQLGFLPNYELFDLQMWKTLLWQFALFGAAFATLLLGAGAMSLDAVIFGGPTHRERRHERDDDD